LGGKVDAIIPAALKSALMYVVKRMVEQPQGARLVRDPMKLEGLVVPGQGPAPELNEELAEKIVQRTEARLVHLRGAEFRVVSDGEWAAAIDAASHTIRVIAPITIADAIDSDLLPDAIASKAIAADPYRAQAAGLSENGAAIYRRVVAESCSHIVEFISSRPGFDKQVQIDLLRRATDMQGKLDLLTDQVSVNEQQESADDARFELRYADSVRRRLDSLQMFGVTLRHDKPYSLSTAYLSLGVAAETADLATLRPRDAVSRLRVDAALADERRVLIRGDAGSGKTTLLQWLAVNSLKEGETVAPGWTKAVPFLILLRRFARRDLPLPNQFCREISPALSTEAPSGWERRVLQDGRGIVLIDGVDELPTARRQDVWRWLRDLVMAYPKSRFVITSRPPATDSAFLAPDGFKSLMLLPMNQADVYAFVRQWHAAMREIVVESDDRSALLGHENDLLIKISQRRDLRRLTTNPLLCAVICALHLDRYRQLPRDRMGLYHAALEMLLVRRDEARAIVSDEPPLSQSDQEALLAQLAYWLVRNGRSEALGSEAEARLEKYMASFPHIESSPREVLRHLVLRSGVLRQPVVGRVDFLHKTFQEYLAAKALLDEGDLDSLIQNAHEDHWREVVVMTVGHARRLEREYVIRGLLDRADSTPELARILYLLAAACLEHPVPTDPELVALVKARVATLIPPRSVKEVDQLASVGEVVLDLIPEPKDLSEDEGIYLLQVLHRFAIEDTVAVFARLATCPQYGVRSYISTQWPAGAGDEYVDVVLSSMSLEDLIVRVSSGRQLKAAARLEAMTQLIASGCSDDVDSLSGHSSLADAVLSSCQVESLTGLGSCPNLEHLVLHGCDIELGLEGLVESNVKDLALFGSAQSGSRSEPEFFRPLSGARNLTRLSVDVAYGPTADTVLDFELSSVKHLTLISSPWMLAASSARAEWLPHIVQFFNSATWRRPSILPFRDWSSVKELTVTGWPTTEEMRPLAEMRNLATLRVVIATDKKREGLLAGGAEYPYPPLLVGFGETLRSLRQLRRIEILAFDDDRANDLLSGREPRKLRTRAGIRSQMQTAARQLPDLSVVFNGVKVQ
jgi:hypothetical protein